MNVKPVNCTGLRASNPSAKIIKRGSSLTFYFSAIMLTVMNQMLLDILQVLTKLRNEIRLAEESGGGDMKGLFCH